jgi:C1A family cysteine protease
MTDDEESFRSSLGKLYRDHYYSRRLKRNIYRRRNQNRRFFSDWFSNFFDKDKNKNNQTTTILDWRTQNVVTSIKNQRKCGSCYAFATAAVMESLYAIKTKSQNPIDFSPQQLIDCSSNGNNGCSGGNFPPSIRFLLGQGGKIATLASYPYAEKKQTCKTSGVNQINLGNIEYSAIPEGDEKKLADALANYGPIFIGLDADSKLFMFYKAGVLKIDNCPNRRQDMDHAMVLVGYGYDNNLNIPYWIIKNSWGTGWGESGYLRLAKDAGNMCGITSMAYSAKLT